MHRRCYLPDSVNHASTMARARRRAEGASRRAKRSVIEERPRLLEVAKAEAKKEEGIRAKLSNVLSRTKKFFTQPISFGRKAS